MFAAETPAPPNILFAIADGWGLHASVYGTGWVKTPAFDRVARGGILFNKGHVGFYEKFMRGEKPAANWVKESDFEPHKVNEGQTNKP